MKRRLTCAALALCLLLSGCAANWNHQPPALQRNLVGCV